MVRLASRIGALALVLAFVAAAGCQSKKQLTISGISPKVGPAMGGDPVMISGSGFQTPGPRGVTVYFGKNKARDAVILSDRQIRVEPPGGTEGASVDVEVVFDDARSAKLKGAYTYINPQRPDLFKGQQESK